MRILILCTHNSARSQMAEGWAKFHAENLGLECQIFSAGTQSTFVKPDAIKTMQEVGIDISNYSSKTLYDLPDPWNFNYVITVCDSANELCPVYPAQTTRLHYPFKDPSGDSLETWAIVRDQIGTKMSRFIEALKNNLVIPSSYQETPIINL
jgi:arsenate reductase (thioredoxin)